MELEASSGFHAVGLPSSELQRDLQATLAALHELGPDYEPQLREALLERLEQDRRRRPAPVQPQPLRPGRQLTRIVALSGAALLLTASALGGAFGAHHRGSRFVVHFYGPHASVRGIHAPATVPFVPAVPAVPHAPPVPPVPPAPPAPPLA